MIDIILLVLGVAGIFVGLIALGWLNEKFWNWYDDAVWDEQEEGEPGPDDFPDVK